MKIQEAINELRSVHLIKDNWLNSDKTNEALELILNKIDNGYTLCNINKVFEDINKEVFTFTDDAFTKHYVIECPDVYRIIKENCE